MHQTRSHTTLASTNIFAALATDDTDDTTDNTQGSNTTTTSGLALPVLDEDTGDLLGHCQLRRHPKYKAIWDTSYADELGRLCQGVGTNATDPTKACIGGTDTFKPIAYDDIPHDRCHEVTYTKVVCEV